MEFLENGPLFCLNSVFSGYISINGTHAVTIHSSCPCLTLPSSIYTGLPVLPIIGPFSPQGLLNCCSHCLEFFSLDVDLSPRVNM